MIKDRDTGKELGDLTGETEGNIVEEYRTKIADADMPSLYHAADVILMPSLFEPCGLNQLISMRYGTPPIVRAEPAAQPESASAPEPASPPEPAPPAEPSSERATTAATASRPVTYAWTS